MKKPAQLEQRVRSTLSLPGEAGRQAMEELALHFGFSGLTWLWGPELYQRDPVVFRPLLLSKFSWQTWKGGWRWAPAPWNPRLDSWLAAVEKAEDVELSQRLIQWKLLSQAKFSHSKVKPLLLKELRSRVAGASSPAQVRLELRKMDGWCPLDEETAVYLFETEPAAAATFILRHLPWDPGKALWEKLFNKALASDRSFAWKIYQRTVPLARFESDALGLCASQPEAQKLVQELQLRNPTQGYGNAMGGLLLKLLEARGEDVFAYVFPQLKRVWKPLFGRGNYGKLLTLAQSKGWIDLWATILRICASPAEYNQALRTVLQEGPKGRHKLLQLSGISSEWNWGGLGLAQVHLLEPKTALALYDYEPELLRGLFKTHLQLYAQSTGYVPLLQKLEQAQELELLDFLASRYCVAHQKGAELDWFSDYYTRLKGLVSFSRRAANVLGKLPAFCIWNYPMLITKNPLARLFFERSVTEYAQDAQAVSDLVEASEIHVMALGYRSLAQAEPEMAAQHLDLLRGCLLRPLQRATRQWAFSALARASQFDQQTASLILESAREAQRMPEKGYPKEALVGLIAGILRDWPRLRRTSEQPVIYRRAMATRV